MNYSFWVILVLLALLYLYNANRTTTTANPKTDQPPEVEKPENRPQSGEVNFNN